MWTMRKENWEIIIIKINWGIIIIKIRVEISETDKKERRSAKFNTHKRGKGKQKEPLK